MSYLAHCHPLGALVTTLILVVLESSSAYWLSLAHVPKIILENIRRRCFIFFYGQEKITRRVQENEEVKNQVQDLLEKGLVKESLSPCPIPNIEFEERWRFELGRPRTPEVMSLRMTHSLGDEMTRSSSPRQSILPTTHDIFYPAGTRYRVIFFLASSARPRAAPNPRFSLESHVK